jgi:hypothetical protein
MLLKLLVLTVVTTALAAYVRRHAELCGTFVTIGLSVLSMIIPGGRVLTIPVVTVLIMIWIFWAARRSAEREEL